MGSRDRSGLIRSETRDAAAAYAVQRHTTALCLLPAAYRPSALISSWHCVSFRLLHEHSQYDSIPCTSYMNTLGPSMAMAVASKGISPRPWRSPYFQPSSPFISTPVQVRFTHTTRPEVTAAKAGVGYSARLNAEALLCGALCALRTLRRILESPCRQTSGPHMSSYSVTEWMPRPVFSVSGANCRS